MTVPDTAPTPSMAQYFEIKAANPDCLLFYRMGDFYELFFEDAEIASQALGIVLTKRGKHLGEDIRMCGVPADKSDEYLHRLISLGHRVAVCEQKKEEEDPTQAKKRGSKSLIQRNVVRLVTAGTITEDGLLEPGRAHLLLAINRANHRTVYGLASLDISTGAVILSETDETGLASHIARAEPREIVAPPNLLETPPLAPIIENHRIPTSAFGREDGHDAASRIAAYYHVETIDGFGTFSPAEQAALALALAFVEKTQIDHRPQLAPPTRRQNSAYMEIDAATRANLELTRTLTGERQGSLFATIDMTKTPAGARLLAERLANPLTQRQAIERRLETITFLIAQPALREALRALIPSVPDFLRSLSRLALERGGPRDLASLRDGWHIAAQAATLLENVVETPAEITQAYAALAPAQEPLGANMDTILKHDLPLDRRNGGFVREGFLAELDEVRGLQQDCRDVIAKTQAQYCETTGVRGLKIKHNNFLGFFIEVPQSVGEGWLKPPQNATFIHRQTMQGTMRFVTEALITLNMRIEEAGTRALALELQIFEQLRQMLLGHADVFRALAAALAELDVSSSLAELAIKREWTCPRIDESLSFRIEGGRHPVVEAALARKGNPFVANDCDLSGVKDEGGRIAIVTGPNMAGKSTYLRQNALIALLAQMGSYVPARLAHIGIVNRLFSRVGAADDLARGRSTFMVEMVETAAILNQASEKSLVILDEIGRGTATYDGLSIAQACIERINDTNRCRTLFATHFHELTRLSETMARVFNLTMRVREHRGELIFLHEMALGVADRSYGIQVARLAGLPSSVIKRARILLAEFETGLHTAPLLLFSTSPTEPQHDLLREMLAALDPDTLSPREAQAMLYELKRAAES